MWPDELVTRFPGAKARTKGQCWDVRCPVHDEQHASATLTINNGKAIISCMVCRHRMSQRVYFASLCKVLNVPETEFFEATAGRAANKSRRRFQMTIEDIYPYMDADANLVFQVVRFREPGGGKTFRARRPRTPADKMEPGDDPGWVWERPTIDVMDGGWLYNYPHICRRPKEPVAVTEGEKDADALMVCGILSTTNAFGAGNWGVAHARNLAGRRVIITEDNDEAGQRHTLYVAGSLIVAGGASIMVQRFTDLPEKADVTDFMYAAIGFTPTKPYHKALEVFDTQAKRKTAKMAFIKAVKALEFVWTRQTAGKSTE
jgi:hypothetical protein